ncbi:hypothetical protein [Candidatus Enterovibrio altilux]|uniref:hypothetical protein n=1 Tax=Candidatus Enterovibrio altilux TaxID=1927128 RepID=UPI001CC26DDB|nr:hypothetical protein [Candidatus Enterovibrio luxaltus]
MNDKKSTTIAVRADITRNSQHQAVVPAIHPATNYEFPEFDEVLTYDYTHDNNPTQTNWTHYDMI